MDHSLIIRSDDLRAENRHRLLRTLRQKGPISRAEVGKLTGLSQASLSTLLGFMTEQGIVTSTGSTSKTVKRGRPQTTIAINAGAAAAVTVSISFNRLSVNLVDYAGVTLSGDVSIMDTRALDRNKMSKLIVIAIKKITDGLSPEYLQSISVGYQGVTDSESGDLLWSPIVKFDRLPIARILKKEFGVPVTVNNDCGLIAKALYATESKILGDSFAALLFSHGVGMGLYLSGQPFSGAQSSALEFGHIQYKKNGALCRCGKQGCIEAYASHYGMLRHGMGLPENEMPAQSVSDNQLNEFVKAATNNNKKARDSIAQAGRAIGAGLATLFTLLDPIPVALVGQSSAAVDLMRDEIQIALNAVGRTPTDYSDLIHCYRDDVPLQHAGLVLEAMATLDRAFADNENNLLSVEIV